MANAGRFVLLPILLFILAAIVIGDLFPQFSPVNQVALGLSVLLGISYMQAVGIFVVVSLLTVAVCYVVAMKKRI
ncbi:MAG: hypothetical protein OK474_03845 [Thaumarchaeota archaeon]|nr:hypothetical protein [Nitrososphaerota archaeon]